MRRYISIIYDHQSKRSIEPLHVSAETKQAFCRIGNAASLQAASYPCSHESPMSARITPACQVDNATAERVTRYNFPGV